MAIVEKEAELGYHQTGHNSGVIHAGIYYKPDSLKAKLCVEGAALAYQYLDAKNIPYKKVGKLIVATDEVEIKRLEDLWDRALKNNCPGVKYLNSPEEIAAIEPNCVGLKAIWSPNTGIVDWTVVNRSYADDFRANGGEIFTKFEVSAFENKSIEQQQKKQLEKYPIVIIGKDGRQIRSRFVVTAAGLHSDKVAQLTRGKSVPKIGSLSYKLCFKLNYILLFHSSNLLVPFRGEYLVLKKERSNIVSTNIYPVPDPTFPFLGVHFTPRMDGRFLSLSHLFSFYFLLFLNN